jgi:hypothetical protein
MVDSVVLELNKLYIMRGKGNTQPMKSRREGAKERLEAQLKTGKKPEKVNGKTTMNSVSLTEFDKKRINNEINAINNPKKKTV